MGLKESKRATHEGVCIAITDDSNAHKAIACHSTKWQASRGYLLSERVFGVYADE